MPSRRSVFFLSLVILGLVVLPGISSAADFTVTPTKLTFGDQVVGTTSARQSILLTNTSSGTISVSLGATPNFTTSSNCSNVAKGGTCTIYVSFSPTTTGKLTSTLVVSDAVTSVSVSLSGTGILATTISPTSLSFGKIGLNSSSTTSTITLTNNQAIQLNLIAASNPNSDYAVLSPAKGGCNGTLAPLASCTFTAVFTPTVLGADNETLIITDDAASSPQSVALTGTGVVPLSVSSSSLTFPTQVQGTTSSAKTVTLTNNQSIVLSSVSLSVAGDTGDFTVSGCTGSVAALGTCKISVTFSPRASGTRSGTFVISSPDAAGGPIGVSLSGTGESPVTITPASPSISVANTDVGLQSKATTITIKNNQKTTLTWGAYSLAGDYQTESTTCGASGTTLGAGKSCTYKVMFVPTQVGTRVGSLTLNDSAVTSPQIVYFDGVGIDPVTTNESSVTFATQFLGTPSPQKQVILTNHQDISDSITEAVTGDFTANDDCGGVIPANSSCNLWISFVPTATGKRTGQATVTEADSSSQIIVTLSGTGTNTPPRAVVTSVSPGAGQAGTSVSVVINGSNTNWSSSSVLSFGSGITFSNQQCSATQCTATATISSTATPGARTVTVTTGTQKATLTSGFAVATSAGLSFESITPPSGAQGAQNLSVSLHADGAHFQQGVTYGNFGAGITINSITLTDSTDAVANISISSYTPVGGRQITLVTGGEYVVSTLNAFTVTADAAQIASITPNTAEQGANAVSIVVVGSNTNFLPGATTVSFGSGINVGAVTVIGPTRLQFDLAVTPTATVGSYTLTVSTGGEVATLANAFTVTLATPSINTVSPNSLGQCQSGNVTVTGILTNFVTYPPTVTFGSDITTGSLTGVTQNSFTVPIQVSCTAQTGGRTGDVTSGTSDFPFNFSVTPSNASLVSVSPNTGPQGASLLSISLKGSNTHWVQGTTQVVFTAPYSPPPPPITVNRVTVTDSQDAVIDVTIPAQAFTGPNPFYVATGGEIVYGQFTPFPATPSVAVTPATGLPGQILPVTFSGLFTNFNCDSNAGPVTQAAISGTGVSFSAPVGSATPLTCSNPNNPASIAATLVIASNAVTNTNHTITLTTGSQIVTTTFTVTSAQITGVTPDNAPAPDTALVVTMTGLNTNWGSGTTVSFGAGITVSSLSVANATTLTATVNISSTAATGWRSVFVNTGSQQLTAPFLVNPPGAPIIASISPNGGAQGQTLSNVQVTGQNTNWAQGLTEFIMGTGVTVVDAVIDSATSATLTLAVSPTAPIGANSATGITKDSSGNIVEADTGQGLNVTGGAASGTITFQSSPAEAAQSETLTLNLVGTGTHWLQGETTAAFDSGISVDAVNVSSETTASIQITVLSNASPGFHTLTVYTAGEIVSLSQALDIVSVTPTLLSFTPTQVQQGTTLNVQLLGQSTLWGSTTTASFGPGVTMNSFLAQDSVTGVANITVSPTAYVDTPSYYPYCQPVTVTTGTQQVSLPNGFCIVQGPAVVSSVSPVSAPLGSVVTVAVTGQNTHFTTGLTTASFGSDLNTSQVQVTDTTHATVQVSVPTTASTGLHTVTMTTLGEKASLAQAFTVNPQNGATLNGVSPASGEQGQTLTTVEIIGQFTHWTSATPTVTFGQGITVSQLSVLNDTTMDVTLAIDPLAQIGARTVTVTTQLSGGAEIVSGSWFSVVAGPAIINTVAPGSGNQGQQVILQITGQNTHWQQGLTQFWMPGILDIYNDIQLTNFAVTSATSATASIAISPTAAVFPRSIYLTTGGEALTDKNAFLITTGPALLSLTPSSAQPGASNLNVTIVGAYTNWLTGLTTANFGPGISVGGAAEGADGSVTINSDTNLTAVISVDPAATIGVRTVTVRNGSQYLSNTFNVTAPPVPYIWYYTPNSGLLGQTLTITFAGQYTQWDPAVTTFDMGSDITVNSFQVTGLTSAVANITIPANAIVGAHTITFTTNSETEQMPFTVVDTSTGAEQLISIVDASSGMQGQSLTVNVIGQYTAFDNTTVFNFGPGITVGTPTILGSTIANVPITIDQLATVGFRNVTAATNGIVVSSVFPVGFTVTPSTAVISTVTPNTGNQGDSGTQLQIVGTNTHWGPGTVFSFGSGITVTNAVVSNETSATITISIAPLATVGAYSLTATTSGEIATLTNAFVVNAETPLILSSGPTASPQQAEVTFTILGQATNWQQGVTTISFGSGVLVNSVTVNGPTSITAIGQISPTAYTGYTTLSVQTGSQILTLPDALLITAGPAAIAGLNPSNAPQGDTLNVEVTGANTNFSQGSTVANFGPGIVTNSLTVSSSTNATANITISPSATVEQNNVTMTTFGEVATGIAAFTIDIGPTITLASPASLAQGATQNVNITGTLTNFSTSTVFNFGSGVTVNSFVVNSATSATVNITVSPIALIGCRAITATMGTQGASSSANLFCVTASNASIASVTPNTGTQGTNGLAVTIAGYQTHFTQATPVVSFGPGITVTNVSVQNNTALIATINISPTAPVQSNTVTVSTGGEVVTLVGGFTVSSQNAGVSVALAPSSAFQGTTDVITVTGNSTNFGPSTTVNFGPDITPGTLSVNGPTSASVAITIDNVAAVGPRTVTITTSGQVITTTFTVIAGIPAVTLINPNTIQPTETETVTVNGAFTNWVNGTTIANFGPGISVGGAPVGTFGPVTLTSSYNNTQTISATLTTSGATTGFNTVQIQTGTQILTVNNGMDVETCTTTTPTVLQISPANGDTNVPLNSQVQVQFSEPMNRSTFSLGSTNSVFFYDTSSGQEIPGTINLDATGTIATISPSVLLPAGRTLVTYLSYTGGGSNYVQDTCGNDLPSQSYSFTAAFSSSTTGPALVGTSPVNGDTNIPLNGAALGGTPIVLQFSKTIDPVTAQNGISIESGGEPVPGNFSYSSTTYTTDTVTFTPINPLTVNTVYTVGYTTQITDTIGNALTNPGSFSFTTGNTAITTGPYVTLVDPPNGASGVGLNVAPHLTFSEPVDGLTIPNAVALLYECYVWYGWCFNGYSWANGLPVAGTVSVAADRISATFTPSTQLLPDTLYELSLCGYTDIAGNGGGCSYTLFDTGTVAVTSSATVTAISPPNKQTGVPLNPQIVAVMSGATDPTTITNTSITLTPQGGSAISGTVTLASDNVTLTFVPSVSLNASTVYNVSVGGFNDTQGNRVTTFTSSFTTGTATFAGGSFYLVSTSPANGATGVSVTSPVTFTMSNLISPASVNSSTVEVYTYNNGVVVAGNYSVNGASVTFTPLSPYPASTLMEMYISGLMDEAGNSAYNSGGTFTTANTITTTPPTVTISPANGATNIGLNVPIVLTFSESINPSTITNNTAALFSGDTSLSYSSSISADNRTVVLNYNGLTLPSGATITVALSNGIQDLSGNALAPITSQFTLTTLLSNSAPYVEAMRPGNGATGVPANTVVTLFTSAAMNASTITGALEVTDNGTVASGSTQLFSNGQSIEFTPANTFNSGDLIQVFLNSTAQSADGVPLSIFAGQFTVAGSPTNTEALVVATNPINGASNVPLNTVIQVQYNQALAASSVNSTNVSLYEYATGTYLNPTLSLVDSGEVINIAPTSSLVADSGYNVCVYNVTNTDGVVAQNYCYSFTAGTASDTAAPTITSLAPTNNATAVGTNTLVSVTFNKAIDPISVTGSTIQLSGGGVTEVPSSISFSPDYTRVSITPQAPVPASTLMTLTINGVTSEAGIAVANSTTTFTTATQPDFAPPYVINSSVESGQTNVPVNSAFSMQFSKPIDIGSLDTASVGVCPTYYYYDYCQYYSGALVPASVSWSADQTTVFIVPTSPLAVGTEYALSSAGLMDLAGNQQTSFGVGFTTAFVSNTNPPMVINTSPENTETAVPTNSPIEILFSEPVQPITLSQVTLTTGGQAVAVTPTFSDGNQLLTLAPSLPLLPNTNYTLTIIGVKDTAGNQMTTTVTTTFTTGPTFNLEGPTVTQVNPANGATGVGTNVAPQIVFSERLNPLSVVSSSNELYYAGSIELYDKATGQFVPATVNMSSDRLTATITPSSALSPNTSYEINVGYGANYYDVAGNYGQSYQSNFVTGGGSDTAHATVTAISPSNGQTAVPLNPQIVAVMSDTVDPITVTNNSITVTPQGGSAVAGSTSLASDGVTLTFVPAAALNASTTYNVSVGGFNDVQGNPVNTFASSFTTGSALYGAGTFTLNLVNPGNGASNVSVTEPVTFTMSNLINSDSASSGTVEVYVYNTGAIAAGTYSVSGAAVTFTPQTPYPANTQMGMAISGLTDEAGNSASVYAGSFTTANTTNTTAPTVTITPPNGTTNAGLNTEVVLTFSKSINPATITSSSVNLFNGDAAINPAVSISSDNRTVVLNYNRATLPAGATITVSATSAITDLSGNTLSNITSEFTTTAAVSNTAPYVVSMRPGNGSTGIPTSSVITLFTSAPMNSSTISSALHVSQNGVIISGTINMGSNGQSIEFTPSAPLTGGASIQVFLDSTAQDIYGNYLSYDSAQFTVAGSPTNTAAAVVATNPLYSAGNVPLNTVIQVQYNQALQADTVSCSGSSGSVLMYEYATGNYLTPNCSVNGGVITITPTSSLVAVSQYQIWTNYTGTLTNTDGVSVDGYQLYFTAGTTTDTVAPTISTVAPPNASINIGTNAGVSVNFNKAVNPISVTGSSIQLSGGGLTEVPSSISFTPDYLRTVVVPQAPLPSSTQTAIAISGVTSEAGVSVASETTHFTTMAGPDFSGPFVVNSSVASGQTVGTNAVFAMQFDEPIDPGSVDGAVFGVTPLTYYCGWNGYQFVPSNVTWSTDLTTIFINPTSALSPSSDYCMVSYSLADLAGNPQSGFLVYFYTGTGAVSTGPAVKQVSPPANWTGVPLNAPLQILFTEPISGASLEGVTLTQNGSVVPTTTTLFDGDQGVQLLPLVPLSPNAMYTINVTGVVDINGNAQSSFTPTSFTTGTGTDLVMPNVISTTPTSGATSVPDNTNVQVVFSEAMDPASFDPNNSFTLLDSSGNTVPATLSFSPDYKTITLTPLANLTGGGATYTMYVGWYSAVYDLGGNAGSAAAPFSFTTQ